MCSMNSRQDRNDGQFDKTEDRSVSQSRNTLTSQVVKSLVTSRHTDSNTRRSDNKNVNQSRDKSPKKAKKNKHKSRKKSKKRSSDTDSSDTDDSTKLLLRLQKERIQQAIERKRQKELMKLKETPEEKRTRRLREKLEKERKRKERMGWDNEYQHYTNTDNPFGDGNLTSTFVWSKKLDKEGLRGLTHADLELRNRHKQFENKIELEKVKKRRQERELERQQREDEVSMLQRSKEAAQFQEWERQEDAFHLEQARLRSCIRIQDGRAKPIDLLAKYIGAEDEVDAVEMHEPYTYLNGLGAQDFEDLVEDIKVYKELERGHNLDYWNDLTVIVEDELHKLRKIEGQSEYQAAVGRREGIHQSVVKDVTEIFKGKTANELLELQKQIEGKISGKNDGVDVGYWESLLSQLKAHMARARLRDRHQENLRKKLQLLQAEQNVTMKRESEHDSDSSSSKSCSGVATSKVVEVTDADAGPSSSHTNVVDTALETTQDTDTNKKESDEDSQDSSASETEESPAEALLSECFRAYDSGGYSPIYLVPLQLEPGTVIVDEETDNNRLAFSRAAKVSGQENKDRGMVGLSKAEQALRLEARKGMGGDEAEFSVETGLEAQVYLWSDKYRPRKPRYFNRVHTGFEWNKYNQTHYDMDNPPPKIVQGYKFNIFYPDLIDKNNTPEYFLTPCPDNRDFALLRFRAGPPYEDIAFKIVSREWEYSYKRGFRCQFHNNVFQLWFHFKRYRYRR